MLYCNDLFTHMGDLHRFLKVDYRSNVAWCINVNDPIAWPKPINYSDIKDLSCAPQQVLTAATPSNAQIRKCEMAWKRISSLISTHESNLFEASQRNNAIKYHAQQSQCSERTLHKDLRRYWQRGMSKSALLPDYNKSGRSNAVSVNGTSVNITSGRGRKHKNLSATFQITSEDAKKFKDVIEKKYLNGNIIASTAAYQELLERHYFYEDGNMTHYTNPPGERPSLRQFQHFIRTHYDIETRMRGRHGDSNFEREHRKILGTVMADCQGVGHYYEIDSTIADVYLVSSEDVNKIIGKPTLYLIIDRKSRLIAGFYFGLENASWNGAMQSILSLSEDKRALCSRYGVKYDPDDWPAHQVFPMEFLADRGDMISHNSTSIADGLHGTVTNLPSKRPDWKPLVECGFRLIHHTLSPVTPAYDPPSNATKRRGIHYEKDACLTVNAFGNLILNAIIAHNRREILNYDMTPAELTAGVRPSPISLWEHGIASRAGQLTRYEESTVRFALLRKDKASVTAKGIEFKGCFYSFPEAIANKWFETARKGRMSVTVSYDTRLIDSIYVHTLNGKGEPYVGQITERSEKYRGLSFDEVKYYEYLRAAVRIESGELRLQNTLNFREAIRPVVDAAKQRLKTEGGKKSRTARRTDVKGERNSELAKERVRTAKIEDKINHSVTTTCCNTALAENIFSIVSTSAEAQTSSAPTSMAEKIAAAQKRMCA